MYKELFVGVPDQATAKASALSDEACLVFKGLVYRTEKKTETKLNWTG